MFVRDLPSGLSLIESLTRKSSADCICQRKAWDTIPTQFSARDYLASRTRGLKSLASALGVNLRPDVISERNEGSPNDESSGYEMSRLKPTSGGLYLVAGGFIPER